MQKKEILKQIKSLNTQLEKKNKKRYEGSYELKTNNKARLQFMYKGIRYSKTIDAKNDSETQKKLILFIEEIKNGMYINNDFTLSEFAQIWIDKSVRPNADEHNCVRSYLCNLNNRILPFLGKMRLKDISKQVLEDYFNNLKVSKTLYKNRENHTIKSGTVKKIRKMLIALFNYAISCDLLLKNPCKYVKITYDFSNDLKIIQENANTKNNKVNYLDKIEYTTTCVLLQNEILELNNNKNYNNDKKMREVAKRIILLVALKTGMRRSEIFGLAKGSGFNDLDLENKTFNVNKSRHMGRRFGRYTKTTKNISSIRIKSLPSSIIPFINIYFNLLVLNNYTSIYIFDVISIDGICSWWNVWSKKNNVRSIRFHDIRHTHATMLLAQGVDIKTISERLGHSDIQTTMNIYADVLKELDMDASEKIDSI